MQTNNENNNRSQSESLVNYSDNLATQDGPQTGNLKTTLNPATASLQSDQTQRQVVESESLVFGKFSIFDYVDKLTPAKEKGKYICPNCDGHNFAFSKEGKFSCFNGCESREIMNALAPLPERDQGHRVIRGRSKPAKKPATLPERINLAKLSQPATDCPQPQKRFDRQQGEVQEWVYDYGNGQYKTRIQIPDPSKEKGYRKVFTLWHRDPSGKAICKYGESVRLPYRIEEAITVAKACGANAVMTVEGEKAVEAYRSQVGLACVTLSSFSNAELALTVQIFKDAGLGLVYHPDHDEAGRNKAAKVQESCDRSGVFCKIINPVAIYPELADKGDVEEILAVMEVPEFIERLEQEIHWEVASRNHKRKLELAAVNLPDEFEPDVEFTQAARQELYRDKPWICVNDILHYWDGTHYKVSLDVEETRRLWRFCNTYAIADDEGNVSYPYAKPGMVKMALSWVKQSYGIDPSLINPPGINCTNGVLQISWNKSVPSFDLVSHDPALLYTYEPIVKFDPKADLINCDRLLAVLDDEQQQVFLRTIAASLDLKTVRSYKGRLVRSLLLKGHGANGKDSLRECVAAMYGKQGMTSVSLTDFAAYDQGRKFPLARLEKCNVNWASENTNINKLDTIQSLKAFVTGDPISIEAKGRDEYDFAPAGIALFNVNDVPNLQASLEAIMGRYAVLSFDKTFKIGADPSKGEIEADPRFKDDPGFLHNEVLPAFLNKVLAALVDLMAEGIDYSCTQKALEDIQAENSHLSQFAQDSGLGYSPNSTLGIGEIWERLKTWYLDNGTLTIETLDNGKQKSIWSDQVRRSDHNVKAANQVLARFIRLFPKAKRCSLGDNKVGIQGLAFEISQLTPKISQSLATGLANNPYPVREISQISQFPKSIEKRVEIEKDFPQRDQLGPEKPNGAEKLANLANPSDTARVTGSSVANELANPEPQLANSEPELPPNTLKVGDRVSGSTPGLNEHQWIGTITQIIEGGSTPKASVKWQEGKGSPTSTCTYCCSKLRQI